MALLHPCLHGRFVSPVLKFVFAAREGAPRSSANRDGIWEELAADNLAEAVRLDPDGIEVGPSALHLGEAEKRHRCLAWLPLGFFPPLGLALARSR